MIAFFLLCLDQYLKYLSYYHSSLHGNYLISRFVLVKNPGISLGLLGNQSWILIASIQFIALILVLRLNLNQSVRTLVIAGGLSNVIDRLSYGYVIDYLQFQLGSFKWPYVVNLADIYLCLALLLWFYQSRKSD